MPDPRTTASTADAPSVQPFVLFTLAIIAGSGAANLYYSQPLLGVLRGIFGPLAPTFVATATLLGYGLGILLLVPLGDTWPRRTLIVTQQLALAAALGVVAIAPNLTILTLASVVVGIFATTAQQAIPFAAELASPNTRGRIVGRTMTGLMLGVLLARTVSGGLANTYGWRFVFAAAAGVALAFSALAAALLPRTRPTSALRYPELLASVITLVREEPVLRWATLTQGCNFAAFNVFWATLSLHLAGAPFHLGPAIAGLFGLVGAVGAIVAPLSGRLADRHGPRRVVICGTATVLASFALFESFGRISLIGITIGVLILDIGVSLAMIANQSRVYALRPEARSRLNTVYMTGAFTSGGLGAFLGTRGYAFGGWGTVNVIGAVFAACAVAAAVATPAPRTTTAIEH
jgi:predicted MFS family arabinose efflux permease